MVKESFSNMSAPTDLRRKCEMLRFWMLKRVSCGLKGVFCVYLLVKESSPCGFPCYREFYKTGIVSSIAKSDEISKIAHLAISLEIMGADILEKLSLSTQKSLFLGVFKCSESDFITFSNARYDICFVKLSLAWESTWGTLFNEEIHTEIHTKRSFGQLKRAFREVFPC